MKNLVKELWDVYNRKFTFFYEYSRINFSKNYTDLTEIQPKDYSYINNNVL